MKNYQKLFLQSKKIKLLENISSLLEWDQETYMPQNAAAIRAEQIELITSLAHEQRTSPSYQELLTSFIDLKTGEILDKQLDEQKRACLKYWLRDFKKAMSLPNEFVAAFAKLSSESMMVWQKARKTSSFKTFAPYLGKILEMCKKKADYLGYEDHPYNALLDLYEPEMTVAKLDPLFAHLQKALTSLVQKIKPTDDSCLHGTFSATKQLKFGHFLLKKIGFDFAYGRLDLSTHPMSIAMHPTDSRITTRIHPSCLYDCISSILHEAGHAFYEMGLDPKHYGSPLCESISLGIHESQSRLWETRIGLSKPFWSYFLPHLKKTFKQLAPINLEQFYHAINKVSPSFIRVEADEVTYPLHVILRYELEKRLMQGDLKVEEIPEAWNDLMEKLLGIRPKNDAEGCLQDVHWSMGGFGYFPTYALGNLYAAHFFDSFEKAHPDWKERLSQGEFAFLLHWLNQNIHKVGRFYSGAELVQEVCSEQLSAKPYLSYLENKYL